MRVCGLFGKRKLAEGACGVLPLCKGLGRLLTFHVDGVGSATREEERDSWCQFHLKFNIIII